VAGLLAIPEAAGEHEGAGGGLGQRDEDGHGQREAHHLGEPAGGAQLVEAVEEEDGREGCAQDPVGVGLQGLGEALGGGGGVVGLGGGRHKRGGAVEEVMRWLEPSKASQKMRVGRGLESEGTELSGTENEREGA
jgi:hypothetical protein